MMTGKPRRKDAKPSLEKGWAKTNCQIFPCGVSEVDLRKILKYRRSLQVKSGQNKFLLIYPALTFFFFLVFMLC